MNSRLDQLLRKEIEKLKGAELYRILKRIESPMNPTVVIEGRELILFSSNNYLGLATHPKLKEASLHALNRYGTGSIFYCIRWKYIQISYALIVVNIFFYLVIIMNMTFFLKTMLKTSVRS